MDQTTTTQNVLKKTFQVYHRDHRSMESYYLDEISADVQFVFGAGANLKRIPAHKTTLASRSVVFHAMFYNEGEFSREHQIEVVDATAEGFAAFLRYFYFDLIEISIKNVAEIMHLADKYKISELLNFCDRLLIESSSLEDIFTALELANVFNRGALKQSCEEQIRKKPSEFFTSDKFRHCSLEQLKKFLRIGNFECNGKDIFNMLMHWSENICVAKNLDASKMENRRKQLGDCLYLIPFRLMQPKQISECVENYRD